MQPLVFMEGKSIKRNLLAAEKAINHKGYLNRSFKIDLSVPSVGDERLGICRRFVHEKESEVK